MKLKSLLIALLGFLVCAIHSPPANAQSVNHNDVRIVKKSLAVGKATSIKAQPCAHVEIGDTGSTKGLLLNGTDSGLIVTPRKGGLIFFSRNDSTIMLWNGKRFRKVALQ